MTVHHLVLSLVLTLGAAATAHAQADPLAPRTKGSPSAPVTVYEMSDFQCPFCKQHNDQTFPLIEREYIETGKVRWIFINFPLTSIHPNAVPAAEFAMCAARQNRFWDAHDILFRTQRTWAPLKNPGPFLMTLVDSLRLQRTPIGTCLQNGETRQIIGDDAAGATRSGARSTPTFYIEGGLMAGAQPIGVFRQILDSIHAVRSSRR